jgi:hypothetical protein
MRIRPGNLGPPLLRLGFGEFGGWSGNMATNNYYCSFFCSYVKSNFYLAQAADGLMWGRVVPVSPLAA